MDLSIIIVSWNTKDLLANCLRSIERGKSNLQLEIIVVDNNSGDGTQEMVAAEFPHVKLIENRTNAGFAAANNQGIAQSRGTYLLMLNPDTEIVGDCLPHTVQFLQENPEIGILGARHLNSDKTIQPSVRRLPRARDLAVLLLKLHKISPFLLNSYLAKDFDYGKSQQAEQVAGSFMAVPREMLNQVGLFDETFFIWFEEVDVCARAAAQGWKIWYKHDIAIIHHGGQSFGQVNTFKKQKLFFKSALQYLSKHRA